ncbi:MAG: endo-1,4-beta-xylanase [Phycisphaeraceae bacterium]
MTHRMFQILSIAVVLLSAQFASAESLSRIDLKGEMALKPGKSDTGAKAQKAAAGTILVQQAVTGDKWAKFSFSFTPSADGKVEVLLRGEYRKDGTEIWINYDKLEGNGASITNGDFEEKGESPKAPAGWEFKNWSQSKVVRKKGAAGAHSGDAYVLVSHTNRIWQSITVQKDQEVTLTLYARLDAQSAPAPGNGGEKKEDAAATSPQGLQAAPNQPAPTASSAAQSEIKNQKSEIAPPASALSGATPVEPSVPAPAAEDAELEAILAKLPQGTLVAGASPEDWTLKNGAAAIGVMNIVQVQGMPFTKAVRMESRKRTDRDYLFQAVTPSTQPVNVGQPLLLTFYARATALNNETSVGLVNIKFFSMAQLGGTGAAAVPVTRDWQKFYFPLSVYSKKVKGFAAGELTMTMNQGLPPQVVEIADIKLMKFPDGVTAKDLPRMEFKVEGREPDAPWRKEAALRIEKIRKGDLTVKVVDAGGKPVADAQVQVRMQRHQFGFGSAYADFRFVSAKDADSQRYREEFVKLFNVAASESGLKWEPWLEARQQAIKAVQWMLDHKIPVRGHTLVWCHLDRLPYADQAKQNYYRGHTDELQKLQIDHIRDEMTALKGMCFEWDLINEPMSHWDYYNLMGMECFLEYFKLAHEIDPNTKLVVNENKLLSSDGGFGRIAFSREDDFYNFLKWLKDRGAPLAGIGIQAHGAGGVTPPARMLQQLDRFAEFGSITITECSITTDNEQHQAETLRDFMTMCFSHPAIENFLMWGFWDGQHFRKNGLIFRKDWSVKPSGQVYKDLVFKDWWTNLDGATDAGGSFQGRGFLGEYEVIATVGDKSQTVKAKLQRDGTTVTVQLP